MIREAADVVGRDPVIGADWPNVTVIVPVYNCEGFLTAGLESVMAQTAPLAEVIIVDDGSTDDSAAVAERFAAEHPIVRVLRRENGGPAMARNDGIEAATSEFLTFHDADDLMLEDRVAVQVSYLLDRPEIALVVGAVTAQVEPNVDPDSVWVRRELANLAHNGGFNPMVMTARASVFSELGGFDPTYRLGEDYNWIVRAVASGCSLAFVPAIITTRRLHGRNVSSAVEASQREMFRSLAEHIRAQRNG